MKYIDDGKHFKLGDPSEKRWSEQIVKIDSKPIERTVQGDGSGDSPIHFKDAKGEVSSYLEQSDKKQRKSEVAVSGISSNEGSYQV